MSYPLKIVSACSDSFRELENITRPNKEAYAQAHGFEIQFLDYPDAESDRGFGRLKMMADAVASMHWNGRVLWMGADTIFTNFGINARMFVIGYPDVVAAWDRHGLQSDVIFLSSNTRAHLCLMDAFAYRNTMPTGNFMADSDQAALVRQLAGIPYRQGIPCSAYDGPLEVKEAHKTINKYNGEWHEGDFVLHAAGLPLDKKIELLSNARKELGV